MQQIAETTARLFGASSVTLQIAEGDEWGQTIHVGASADSASARRFLRQQLRIGGQNLPGTVVARKPADSHSRPRQPRSLDGRLARPAAARAAGTAHGVGTPLRREGKAIGALIVYRDRLAPFTDEELALQQSFADQAVIAIENARLFNETKEALERQTATAEILKVIASSPSDVQPVFEAIADSANRLIGGFSTAVYSLVDDMQHLSAFTAGSNAGGRCGPASVVSQHHCLSAIHWAERDAHWRDRSRPRHRSRTRLVPATSLDVRRMRGYRGFIVVPLLRDGRPSA